jgi:hypothetical protein
MNDFEKIIKFEPAYDKRAEGYGQHGVNLMMVLKKNNKAVHFLLYTGWHLDDSFTSEPMAADRGYHSPVKMYEEQNPIEDNCNYTGGLCYSDGSCLDADRIFKVLKEKGSDGVWEELEEYYISKFGDKNENY